MSCRITPPTLRRSRHQWLGSQYLTLQFGANLKGSAARRFDRRRMAKMERVRHQSPARSERPGSFGRNCARILGCNDPSMISAGLTSTRGNSQRRHRRGLELDDAKQCRQFAACPVYAAARANISGEPISTAQTESAVHRLLHRRMTAKQQMRWSPRGAHFMLKVRTSVMNGTFERDHIALAQSTRGQQRRAA